MMLKGFIYSKISIHNKKGDIIMSNKETTNANNIAEETAETEFFDEKKTQMDLEGLASVSKETKKSMAYVSDKQVRLIIDNYYATQQHRMNVANQIRAVAQGYDKVQDGEQPAIAWLLADIQNRENQISKMIAEYVKTVPVCQWAIAVKGIGPIFAANLWSYIDMNQCKHANQFLSYAGLNDNNAPWLGKEKATALVDEAYEKFNLDAKAKPTPEVFAYLAQKAGRNCATIMRGFENHKKKSIEEAKKKKDEEKKSASDKTRLKAYMAKPPYNADLKKMCYLIGQSFVKVANRDSLYGRLYKERKATEILNNENGMYADQAAKLLSEKNYKKNTDTYKFLSEGKLSPAHIDQRAQRWATKIFLTHFFECAYIYTHHEMPPEIYPIAHMGHVDYIEPEVPYALYVK